MKRCTGRVVGSRLGVGGRDAGALEFFLAGVSLSVCGAAGVGAAADGVEASVASHGLAAPIGWRVKISVTTKSVFIVEAGEVGVRDDGRRKFSNACAANRTPA